MLTRLFGFPESVWEEPRKFVPQAEEKDGRFIIVFSADGCRAEKSAEAPDDPDERLRALHRRRAARRLCKQALYDLLKQLTGRQPPWGSLTGVRPTHLMLEALKEGLAPEAASARLTAEFDVAPDRALLYAARSVAVLRQDEVDALTDAYLLQRDLELTESSVIPCGETLGDLAEKASAAALDLKKKTDFR